VGKQSQRETLVAGVQIGYCLNHSIIKPLNYSTISLWVNIMKYKVVLQKSEEGFAVSVPGLPGCHSQGATEQEALENISDAIADYLAVVEELVNHHGEYHTRRRLEQ